MGTLAPSQTGDHIAGLKQDDCVTALKEIASYLAGSSDHERQRDHELMREAVDEILDTWSLIEQRLEILMLPEAPRRAGPIRRRSTHLRP